MALHAGPVAVRFGAEHYTVLCPLGHLVTAGETGRKSGFAGSFMEAKISAHQNGGRRWLVECDGATEASA